MKAHATILAILLLGVLPAFTQSQPSKQEPSSPYTLELNAEEVVLNCTVLDSKGQLVDGLDKSNFIVVEDKIPQPIISLQHQDTRHLQDGAQLDLPEHKRAWGPRSKGYSVQFARRAIKR